MIITVLPFSKRLSGGFDIGYEADRHYRRRRILAAGFIGSMDPTLKWGLAAIAGGRAAGIIQGGMSAIRGAASAATGGLGNSVVTTAETASASIVAVLACVLPVAAVLLAAAAIYFLVRTGLALKRKLRRSPGGPEGEI